jgi:hypothetical protein
MAFDAKHGEDDMHPGDGLGRFMHRTWAKPVLDYVQDDLIPGESPTEPAREYVNGSTYGPYQIAPCATGETGVATQLYFAMSTWNPYQVMLMTTKLAVEELLEHDH